MPQSLLLPLRAAPFLAACFLLAAPRTARAVDTSLSLGLRGYAWGMPYNSQFYFDENGKLGNLSANLRGNGFTAEGGNVSAGLGDLGFGSRGFDGLKITAPIGRYETTFLAGQSVFEPDILDPLQPIFVERRQIRSTLFGVNVARSFGEKWRANVGQFFAPDFDGESGNAVGTLGLSYFPDKSSQIRIEGAASKGGTGLQLSAQKRTKRFDVRASLRSADRGLSSAGNSELRYYRKGYSLNGSVLLADNLRASLFANRYDDDLERISRNEYVGLSWAPPKKPSLSVYYQSRLNTYPFNDPILGLRANTQIETRGPGLATSYSFGATNLGLSYDLLDYRYSDRAQSNSKNERLTLRLGHRFDNKTSISLIQGFERERSATSGDNRDGNFTIFDVSRRLNRAGMRISLGFERQKREFRFASGTTNTLRVGFDLPAGRWGTLGFSYRGDLGGSGDFNAFSRDRLSLRYSRSLNFGPAPNRNRLIALGLPEAQRRQLGRLRGRVFEDANLNGRFDAGEIGVRDVSLKLRGSDEIPTGEDGQIALKDLRPGAYEVAMSVKTLPLEYTIVSPTQLRLELPPSGEIVADFPVVRTGAIAGVAFWDTNRNGTRDNGEGPVADAVIRVENSESIAFTDREGRFTIYNLAPKTWQIGVDVESLRRDAVIAYENTGEPLKSVAVRPNQTTSEVKLGVAERQREVIFEDLSGENGK